MKVLVNAVSCRVAGGRTVAQNFLRSYRAGSFSHDLVVYAPGHAGYEDLAGGRVTVKIAPSALQRGLLRPWADHVWLRRVLADESPDLLFAMGSIAYPTKLPQLVLYHWPYAIYPEKEVWDRMGLADWTTRRVRRWLFGRRIRYASCFAAQTETVRERLLRLWGIADSVVVPNAVSISACSAELPPDCLPKAAIPRGKRALLCLTRYYPHKNLEILLELSRLIDAADLPLVILTTVSASDGPAACVFLDAIRREGLEAVLVNLGTVPMEQVPALYAVSSGLLLPTLMESFSGTYVDSMRHRKPVFTSDRDFARDVCSDVAYYFDPQDAGSILAAIQEAFADPIEMRRRVDAGEKRCARFPDWPEVTRRYVQLLEQVAREP
jgi:glycosyltransferase involved in cell wall biosynthesis